MIVKKCLICGQVSPDSEFNSQNVSLLERQLNAVFVLRELFELPKNLLENWLLRSAGDNPASWITICEGQCQEIVENAQRAYREMQRARLKILACQKKILDKIGLSSSAKAHLTNQERQDYRTEILETVQEVVSKRIIPKPDDFASGDRMADQLLAIRQTILNQPKPIPNFIVQKLELESSSEPFEEMEIVDHLPDTKPHLPRRTANFPCDQCDKTFNSAKLLNKHKRNCHFPKTRKCCPHCDYTTDHCNYTLKRHIRIMHDKSQIWVCDICQKKFNVPRHLTHHQALYHKKCSVKNCGIICGTQQKLRDHQVDIHGREVDVFQCSECGLICRTRYVLRDHLHLKHKKGKREKHFCSQCDMAYPTRKQLTDHMYNRHKKRNKNSSGKEDLILGI